MSRQVPLAPRRGTPILPDMSTFVPSFVPLLFILFVVILRRPAIALRRRGAISPATAVPLAEMSASYRRRFTRLVARGVIREAAPGTYYYDAAGQWALFRKRLPLILAVLGTAFAISLALAYRASHSGGQ